MQNQVSTEVPPLEKLVEELADGMKWNWTRMCSNRDAADVVLARMAQLGMIQKAAHPLGGHIWIVNGKLYGRTDGVTMVDGQIQFA